MLKRHFGPCLLDISAPIHYGIAFFHISKKQICRQEKEIIFYTNKTVNFNTHAIRIVKVKNL